MFKYEYVNVDLKSGFMSMKPREDYKKIIDEYAEKGWRLVQIFAPAIEGYGSSGFYELILEKKLIKKF